MRYYAILLAIVPFVSLLTSHMSIQLTIWMFWLLAAIFLLSLPIMRANHRLKTWKTQNHLYEDRQPEHYVELKPYNRQKFEGSEYLIKSLGTVAKGGQCIKGLGKSNISIYKVRTDVLGNQHIIKNEGDKPKLDF